MAEKGKALLQETCEDCFRIESIRLGDSQKGYNISSSLFPSWLRVCFDCFVHRAMNRQFDKNTAFHGTVVVQ